MSGRHFDQMTFLRSGEEFWLKMSMMKNDPHITFNKIPTFPISKCKEQKGIQYCSIKNELAFHILKLEATHYSELSIFSQIQF